MHFSLLLPGLLPLLSISLALSVPPNMQDLYKSIKAKGQCTNKLATGFRSSQNGPSTFSYCADHLNDYGILYIQGDSGALTNMDVDCDGSSVSPRCRDSSGQTAFKDVVRSYKAGVDDLDAAVHPYVVLGSQGRRDGYVSFDPQSAGVEPLSVVAVVCGNAKMFYGVWADTNGDDDAHALVGEASLSLATACFGDGMSGSSGHDADDVLYVAFRGKEAVPGAKGAKWAAKSFDEFHDSIKGLGDSLVKRVGGGGTNTEGSATTAKTAVQSSVVGGGGPSRTASAAGTSSSSASARGRGHHQGHHHGRRHGHHRG